MRRKLLLVLASVAVMAALAIPRILSYQALP